jgi:hypothetical protein
MSQSWSDVQSLLQVAWQIPRGGTSSGAPALAPLPAEPEVDFLPPVPVAPAVSVTPPVVVVCRVLPPAGAPPS